MTLKEKEWILSLSKEHKFKLMESMLKQNAFGEYMAFIKILLDAPIHKGGISTDEINIIWKKYSNKENTNK